MNTKNAAFRATALVPFLSIAAAGCGEARSSGPPAAPPPEVPVRVVAAERVALPRAVRAIGRLAHKRSLTLAFKNGGTVRALYVQEGAVVKKGQRLALVDQTEIGAQVAQARAAVEKADRDLARVQKLQATQAIAQSDADNARTAAEVSHASLAAALYNQGASVLVAPEDGRVDKRYAEVGEQVGPGRPIFAMSGSAAGFVVRVGVIDRDLVGMKLGDPARVSVDALPGRSFTAQVSELATAPSPPAGTYEVELRVATEGAPLTAGMTAKAELPRTAAAPLPVVPLGALIDADGLAAAIYTLAPLAGGYTVARQAIQIAYIIDDRVAVASGLTGGERVVSEGAAFVEPGRRVRPIQAVVADANR